LYLTELAIKENDAAGLLAHAEELWRIRQTLLNENQDSLKAKRDLADADLRLGDAYCYAREYAKAYERYRDSLTWNEQVMWSEPRSTYYRSQLCQSHYCVGCGALKSGDRKAAEHHFREALKGREELYSEFKAKGAVDHFTTTTLMLALARCGEHQRASALPTRCGRGQTPVFSSRSLPSLMDCAWPASRAIRNRIS
jgi:hypothetical protein